MRRWSIDLIVAEVKRRASTGLSIKGPDVQREDKGLYTAASRHLGKKGWQKARKLAGFQPIDSRPWQKWTDKKVCSELRRLYEAGVDLNTTSEKDHPELSRALSAGRKIFGSRAKAIRAAGFNYSKIRKVKKKGWWTIPRVLSQIRRLEKRGVRLSSRSIRKTHGSLHSQAYKLEGLKNWGHAVEMAGIPYRAHCRIWSTKAWLLRMKDDEYQDILARAQTYVKKGRRK